MKRRHLDPLDRGLRRTLAPLVLAGLAAACGAAQRGGAAARGEAFSPEAAELAYPYPVRFFDLESQRQRLRMAYLDVAPERPNGRVVVLLHGKNFHAGTWARTIESLRAAGFRVVAPDQIGFGKSSKPAAYQFTFRQLAANTRALLASLGVERVAVVGHSMGGMLAVRYALDHPAATDALVLVNPIGLEDHGAFVPPRTVDDWYAQELSQTPEAIRAYQRDSYYDGAWKPEYGQYTRLLEGWTRHPEYPRVAWVHALTTDMVFTQPVLHDFPRLRVPTRLVIGTRDRTAPGRALAPKEVRESLGDYTTLGKRAQARIPGAELVELDGVGHVPHVEAFERFEEALLGFLR